MWGNATVGCGLREMGLTSLENEWMMKKLSKEEAEKIRTRPSGRGSYAYKVLMAMRVGEIILLERKDWTWKSRKPGTYCKWLERKKNRKWNCAEAVDGSGWVIERVK